MGYTHYFNHNREATQDEWDQLVEGTKALFEALPDGVVIAEEYDKPHLPPIANAQEIRFNGVDDLGHETFLLEPHAPGNFTFCKTARKPYDLVVCGVLILAHDIAPGLLRIDSDGGIEDGWGEALEWTRAVFNDPSLKLPFEEE